jgi:hypothetical protein
VFWIFKGLREAGAGTLGQEIFLAGKIDLGNLSMVILFCLVCIFSLMVKG